MFEKNISTCEVADLERRPSLVNSGYKLMLIYNNCNAMELELLPTIISHFPI